jgi:hypothetical protein
VKVSIFAGLGVFCGSAVLYPADEEDGHFQTG